MLVSVNALSLYYSSRFNDFISDLSLYPGVCSTESPLNNLASTQVLTLYKSFSRQY